MKFFWSFLNLFLPAQILTQALVDSIREKKNFPLITFPILI